MEDFTWLEILLKSILFPFIIPFIISFIILWKEKNYNIDATRINKIHDYYADILNKLNEHSNDLDRIDPDFLNKINMEEIPILEKQRIKIVQNTKETYGYIFTRYRIIKPLLDKKYQKVMDEMENKEKEISREFSESIGTESGEYLFIEIIKTRACIQAEFERIINEQLQDFYRARRFMDRAKNRAKTWIGPRIGPRGSWGGDIR